MLSATHAPPPWRRAGATRRRRRWPQAFRSLEFGPSFSKAGCLILSRWTVGLPPHSPRGIGHRLAREPPASLVHRAGDPYLPAFEVLVFGEHLEVGTKLPRLVIADVPAEVPARDQVLGARAGPRNLLGGAAPGQHQCQADCNVRTHPIAASEGFQRS